MKQLTAKEKAKDLVDDMQAEQEGYYLDNIDNAKECALIAVNLLIKHDTYNCHDLYWQEVKNEIEKL